jgi:succinoglycan biosynthesis transport protein ExoP
VTAGDYLQIIRSRWLIVVAVTVLSTGAAAGVFFLQTPTYTAKLTTYVSARTTGTDNSAYQSSLLSQQRVTSYVQLVSSVPVAEKAVAALQLGESPEALAKQVSATNASDSVLIDITVTDRSPERAAQLANAVGDAFIAVVADLEKPDGADGVPEVRVRAVAPAKVPTGSTETSLPVHIAIGLLLGVGLGVAAALVRNALDTSVKTAGQLHDLARGPVLGTIALDTAASPRRLVVRDAPQSGHAEAFRHLRTNLQFLQIQNACKVITVSSSLAGEGKTTTVCNLAMTLASAGSRVLVIEADLRRPRIAALLGIEGAAGLTNVLAGRLSVERAVQPWAAGPFDVIAAGPLPPNPSELLASPQMAETIEQLRADYDYIVVDTPPLLPVTDAAALAPATDGVLLVCRYRHTSKADVQASVGSLAAVSAPLLGTVLTMIPESVRRADTYATYRADGPMPAPAPVPRRAATPPEPAPEKAGPTPPPVRVPVPRSRIPDVIEPPTNAIPVVSPVPPPAVRSRHAAPPRAAPRQAPPMVPPRRTNGHRAAPPMVDQRLN